MTRKRLNRLMSANRAIASTVHRLGYVDDSKTLTQRFAAIGKLTLEIQEELNRLDEINPFKAAKIPEWKEKKIREMRRAGKTIQEIADATWVSIATVCRYTADIKKAPL